MHRLLNEGEKVKHGIVIFHWEVVYFLPHVSCLGFLFPGLLVLLLLPLSRTQHRKSRTQNAQTAVGKNKQFNPSESRYMERQSDEAEVSKQQQTKSDGKWQGQNRRQGSNPTR